MVRSVLALVLMLVVSAAPSAKSPDAAVPVDRTAEIVAQVNAWGEARVKGDIAFLKAFYAPDLVIGGANGSLIPRDDDIGLFAAGLIKPEYIRDTDVNVRFYGDVAVVTCIESVKGTYRGVPGEMSLRMMNVLRLEDGHWRLIATQSAQIK